MASTLDDFWFDEQANKEEAEQARIALAKGAIGGPSKYLQEYLQSDGYPIIKIPQRIIELLGDTVPIPPAPVKPAEPKKPILKEVPIVTPPRRSALSWLGLDEDYTLKNHIYKMQLEARPILIEQYKIEYKQSVEKYKSALEIYKEETLKDYEREIIYYEHIKKLCQSDINDVNSRMELVYLYLYENATKLSPCPSNDLYTKGIAEPYFREFLLEHYKDELILNPSTIVSEGYQKFYAPDFILQVSGVLRIDIEIDEPYVASSNKPIHYLDNLNETKRSSSKKFILKDLQHVDSKRDKFFTSNNWIVIRFTEKQVIESPKACISIIDEIIIYTYMKCNECDFIPSDKVEIEEKWTEYTAKRFADKKYRQSYLPPRLAQAVTDARNAFLKDGHDNLPYYDDDDGLPY